MKTIIFMMLYLAIFPIFKAQADSLIRIKCDDQDIGTKVYFNNKLAGECPFDKFIPEGKISIRAHKMVNSDYEQFFNKEVFAVEGGIQKIELVMSSAQLTAHGQRRQEEAQAKQKALDEQLREQQRIKQLKAENAKGVWIDKSTGLMWQDDEDAKTVEKNWQGAMDYCENLALADYDDWRLPDKDIIRDLYRKNFSTKFLKNIDPGIILSMYWTSSKDSEPFMGRDVYFINAINFHLDTTESKKTFFGFIEMHLRCVRDNKY